MTRTTVVTLAIGALAVVAFPAAATASLGGTVSTVENDRVQMKSALVRIIRNNAFTFHELQSPTGTIVREYYSSNGAVFGVAWQGSVAPDLRQLLGTYFEQYQSAIVAARQGQRTRGVVIINKDGLIVQAGGHRQSFSGFAYVPSLMPQGVDGSVVR